MSIDAQFLISHGNFTLDVDLHLPGKGITGLFGPSGSGKTTLLRALTGLDRHRNGQLSINDVVWQSPTEFLEPHQRALGVVFQEASLFDHLSVRGNLDYAHKRVPSAQRSISLARAIGMLQVEPLLDRRPHTLSGGERQRVAIARALAASPQLLLMDEPLAGLDPESKAEILPCLDTLHHDLEIPVLYVSHAPREVASLADHLVLLDEGRVTAEGSIHQLLTRLDLSLAQGSDAESIIDATVTSHDDAFHLTTLGFPGGSITVPQRKLPMDTAVRLHIAARDVSITLDQQRGTSIQNILPATIDALSDIGPATTAIRLLIGDIPLLAHITKKSATILNLKPNQKIYAQIKSAVLQI